MSIRLISNFFLCTRLTGGASWARCNFFFTCDILFIKWISDWVHFQSSVMKKSIMNSYSNMHKYQGNNTRSNKWMVHCKKKSNKGTQHWIYFHIDEHAFFILLWIHAGSPSFHIFFYLREFFNALNCVVCYYENKTKLRICFHKVFKYPNLFPIYR